jgi:hypothetical protein
MIGLVQVVSWQCRRFLAAENSHLGVFRARDGY